MFPKKDKNTEHRTQSDVKLRVPAQNMGPKVTSGLEFLSTVHGNKKKSGILNTPFQSGAVQRTNPKILFPIFQVRMGTVKPVFLVLHLHFGRINELMIGQLSHAIFI